MSMEIVDYLKAARRRAWLLILLPLLSAGAAAGLVLYQPQTYTSTATIDPPALVGGTTSQYTGSQGVIQFVSAFQATATGPMVRDAVVKQTNVSLDQLTEQLAVTQRGGSSSINVTFTTQDKGQAKPVVESLSKLTLQAMFSSQVVTAAERVKDANAAVAEANKAIGAFTTAHKMADPQKAYEAQLNRVNGMVQQQASMRAAGNAVGAAAMASPIAAASAELDKFGPILNEYSTLLVARDAAVATLNSARATLSQATSQLEAADPARVVFVSEPRAVDRLNTAVRAVIAVAAAAFFLSLLLILLIEVVGRARRMADEEGTPTLPLAAARPLDAGHENGHHDPRHIPEPRSSAESLTK
jgi:capsular polysaccharide biosynthesis protein